ncbi:G-protein coupled receptor dmsr-1-like [Crassostrea virginica]
MQVTDNISYSIYSGLYEYDSDFEEGNVLVGEQTWLLSIANGYTKFHGYISLVICVFGILTNMVIYSLVASQSTLASHNASVWLGVSLTIFRFLQSRSRHHIPKRTKNLQTAAVVCTALVISVASSVPNTFANRIEKFILPDNQTIYIVNVPAVATNNAHTLVDTNVLLYAIVGKLLPCFLMILFVGVLVHSLHKRSQRFSFTTRKRSVMMGRTNRLLYAIVILFLITELPQGALVLLCAFVPGLYENVYIPLGDFFDFIALTTFFVNFILYCIMSSKFRSKVKKLCYKNIFYCYLNCGRIDHADVLQ